MTATADDTLLRPAGRFAGWTVGFLRFIEASHGSAVILLAMVALAAFLPGFVTLQPMDRDEPRFAQASKQMLETGDFVDIRFQEEARHKKPVGIYWLQSAAVSVGESLGVPEARTTIALYRLPSLAGALAVVLLTYWAALALGSRREAFLAALFMAASILLGVEARLAKTDAMLSACCVAAMGGLARAYLAGRTDPRPESPLATSTVVIFWFAMALGILVKGPIAPMVVGLAALVLSIRDRSARWLTGLRPWLGLGIVVLAVTPWLIAIAIRSGGAFFAEALGKDMLAKVGAGQERHGGPPGTYLVVFFATFWPIAPFAAMAVPHVWQQRRDAAIAFCLAWIVPSWIVFEFVPTKLPHYVLPLYPAVAFLAARALTVGAVGTARWGSTLVALLVPLMAIGVLIGLAVAGQTLEGILPFMALPVLALACLIAGFSWLLFRRGQPVGSALVAVAASLVLSAGVFGLGQQALRALKLSPRLAETVKAMNCPSPAVATAGYREPSLVFLVSTDLAMVDGAGAAQFLAGGQCRMAFVEAKEEAAFTAAAPAGAAAPRLVTRVGGFNINGGKRLDIGVYASAP